MSGAEPIWQVRKAGEAKMVAVAQSRLAELILREKVTSRHEMRLDGTAEWLTLAQARPFIVPAAPKPASQPTQRPAAAASAPGANVDPVPAPQASVPVPPTSTPKPQASVPAPQASPAPQTSPAPQANTPAPQTSVPAPQTNPSAPTATTTSAQASVPPPPSKSDGSRWSGSPVAPPSPASPAPASDPSQLPTSPPERRSRAAMLDEDSEEVDMTPMIDMTFLLLIFFMVTSTLSPFADLQLPEARAGDAEKPEGRVVLVLDYGEGHSATDKPQFSGSEYIELKDCRIYLADDNETTIPPDQLLARLTQAFVDNGGGEFILQSNRKMPVGVVREVIKTAKAAGAGDTMIGVTRPK